MSNDNDFIPVSQILLVTEDQSGDSQAEPGEAVELTLAQGQPEDGLRLPSVEEQREVVQAALAENPQTPTDWPKLPTAKPAPLPSYKIPPPVQQRFSGDIREKARRLAQGWGARTPSPTIGNTIGGSDLMSACADIINETVRPVYNDGETEINVSEDAITELGKQLSMGYSYAFEFDNLGRFACVGGLYSWLSYGQADYYRTAVGQDCSRSRYGSSNTGRPDPRWRILVAAATYSKIVTLPGLAERLANSWLPFRHYVQSETSQLDVRTVSAEIWYVPMLYECQRVVRHNLANPENQIEPDFGFLAAITWHNYRHRLDSRFVAHGGKA